MTAPDLRFDGPVTLAGGAPFSAADLALCLALAGPLLAADSGADRLLGLGHVPRAVIGDLDSLSGAGRAALPPETLIEVGEQDSTDFEKCLSRIAAPLVVALGFAGGRVDHALSVFNTLVRYPDHRCVVVGDTDVVCLAPPEIALDLIAGDRLSLFPLRPVRGSSAGLVWPIAGHDFAPGGMIGTSNRAAGPVTLGFAGPGMLLILPRCRLDRLIAGLAEAPRW
ncbi:MAG: thiamine diphosphokinase [Qingshengfaniella sp.]